MFISVFAFGQNAFQLEVHIADEKKAAVQKATIIVGKKSSTTNSSGISIFTLPEGNYTLQIAHPNHQEKEISVNLTKNTQLKIQLQSENKIEEVFITAKEKKGLTSTSVIDKKAMEHLQSSSFTDLLELLPGGLSKDPNFNSVNKIALRESEGGPSGYNTSALGTQFMIDDNVLNTNSNLLTSADPRHLSERPLNLTSTGIGVDMRTISTNDIEKVEIVRGIPTAAYGDLTSGLIKIERKIGSTPLQARFKADGFSKQYYVGKGFSMNENWQLNANIDLLDSKNNPTDSYDNYQRLTGSIRSKLSTNLWNNPLEWRSIIDLSSNIDTKEIDPDTGVTAIDKYKNTSLRISFANNFVYTLTQNYFFNRITLNTAVRQGFDQLKQSKLINLSGPRSLPLSFEAGENIGFYPALRYISDFTTNSNPIDLTTALQTNGNKKLGNFQFQYEAGLDWRYSKNLGNGMQWDLASPPNSEMGLRPRSFNDIPAWQNGAVFIGNELKYTLAKHTFNLYTGLRLSKLLGLDSSYKISGESYLEPRVNFQYQLPNIMINEKPLNIDFTVGYGEFYKTPTMGMLFPNQKYWDYAQLNYFNNDENYRYVNFMTFIENTENKDLVAAKNIKKEIRIDLSYKNHTLFVTYFKEDLNNGFRSTLQTKIHEYKQYNAAFVNHNDWNNGPNLANIPYTIKKEFGTYTTTENGSATLKKGVEFGYSSPRFKAINTRLTLTGAWFRSEYRNTVPVVENPPISLGGQNFPYYGIYKSDQGYINESMNYNLMIDTYLPQLGLTVSASLQGNVYDYKKRDERIPEPEQYYGLDGMVHQFQPSDASDAYLQWLVRGVASDHISRRFTHTIQANLKVTKVIYKGIRSSMFVNRIFNYQHPYTFLGNRIYRKVGSNPYFGMELTYNF